jgi:type I restriction enzyme S subunit
MRSRKTEFESKQVWQDILLGDDRYFQLATGGTPSTERKEYWENGTVPWLSSGEVHKKIIRFADGRITEEGFHHSNARFYPTHSTLIALAGQGKTRGTAAITEIEVTSNQSIAAVIPNKELVEPYFVYYYVDSLYQELRSISAGAGRAGLNLSILAKVPIRLPNKPVQERIAAVLSCIDRGIEHTEAFIAKQGHIKTGLTDHLLTKGIDEHGKIRTEETHEFKDSLLGRIPKEWDAVTIDEITIHIGSGITPTGGSSVYESEGIIFIRSQNVYDDGLRLEDVAYINERINAQMERSQVLNNDVLLNITGASIGRCCCVPLGFQRANVNQHVCIIRLSDSNEADAFYLATVLSSSIGQTQIKALNAGGNREGINYQQIKNMIVPMPSDKDERSEISKRLTKQKEGLKRLQIQLEKMKRIKQGLMQDLLTGKISVASSLPEDATGDA